MEPGFLQAHYILVFSLVQKGLFADALADIEKWRGRGREASPGGRRQVDQHIWLVTFVHNDLGYFDNETCGSSRFTISWARECYPCLRNSSLPVRRE